MTELQYYMMKMRQDDEQYAKLLLSVLEDIEQSENGLPVGAQEESKNIFPKKFSG